MTAELRHLLPAVSSSTNGFDRVVWRYGGQRVTGMNDGGCYRIQPNQPNQHFGGLQDFERQDAFTAETFAKLIASHFDPELSVADR